MKTCRYTSRVSAEKDTRPEKTPARILAGILCLLNRVSYCSPFVCILQRNRSSNVRRVHSQHSPTAASDEYIFLPPRRPYHTTKRA